MAYLRNRPFLVVEFREQPAEKVNTRVAGWQNDRANIRMTEHASVVDRIGKKQMAASVIIDCIEGKTLKNTTSKPDEEVISYFIGKNADMITNALQVWAGRMLREGKSIEAITGPIAESNAA